MTRHIIYPHVQRFILALALFLRAKTPEGLINPYRAAVSFWGQSTQISSSLSPNRDCGSKRVNTFGTAVVVVQFQGPAWLVPLRHFRSAVSFWVQTSQKIQVVRPQNGSGCGLKRVKWDCSKVLEGLIEYSLFLYNIQGREGRQTHTGGVGMEIGWI